MFTSLRLYNIKLNPEKCIFEVPKGKLLGFIVSEWGIEANPKKIAAIQNLGPITALKGVQKLMGCLASLSWFISRLGEHGMSLYKLLKKSNQFRWMEEAQQELDHLKEFLASPPTLFASTWTNPSYSMWPQLPRLSAPHWW